MKKSAVLAIDQGTTGSRAILYDRNGREIARAYQEFQQYYPQPGWVEHDAEEIWHSVLRVIRKAVRRARIPAKQIAAIGITNQRETTVLWDRHTGRPVARAIVWQDRRTAAFCDSLRKAGHEAAFRRKTGLVLDPYFSGTKIHWLLNHHRGLKQKARAGKILFGTMDSWLLWKLTGGAAHKTDFTNASRTLLFNIRTRRWDAQLLRVLQVPPSMLPEAQASGQAFGTTVRQGGLPEGIPIHAMVGDQQAALYGQGCYETGAGKNTYGTGCFVVVNSGRKYQRAPQGLLQTLACDAKGNPVYALEGSIFIGGAVMQWLRDGLGFFKRASESEALAKRVPDTGGVVFIPAFVGLGSPYWNPHVRGTITGLTRGTRREHVIRAALEAMAHQTADVLEAMQSALKRSMPVLKADGGATANGLLMQMQADFLGIPVGVSDIAEATAWGAAKLAAYSQGFWKNLKVVDRQRHYRFYKPRYSAAKRKQARQAWKSAVQHLLTSV